MTIHLMAAITAEKAFTACGKEVWPREDWELTSMLSKVTCGACKGTDQFKDTLKRIKSTVVRNG